MGNGRGRWARWGLSTRLLMVACGDDGSAAGTETDGGSSSTGAPAAVTTVANDDTTSGDDGGSSDEGVDSTGEPPAPPPNEPPTAVLEATPTNGQAPLTVDLDGSASSDPDGEIAAHNWDLGDGNNTVGATSQASYDAAGCYDIQLTVTDDDGAMATAAETIVVVDQLAAGKPDVVLASAPLPSAVLARDLETNEGTAHFAGTVNSVGYAMVVADVMDGKTVVSSVSVPLCGAAPVEFEIDVPIPAELVAHDVRLSLVVGETATEFASVSDLVAGDLYLIQGQSNAFASQFNGDANPENQGPFIRSFGVNSTNGNVTVGDINWYMASGNGAGGQGGVGQWPIRMAALLAETHQVPIALINGSLGGQPIGYFQRDDADPTNLDTNYGRLLTRLRAAGIDRDLRAILWYQGESDGADAVAHHDGFVALYEDWLEDYGDVEQTYVTQIRAGCGGAVIGTQEVQRLLADDYEAISVMSTTALNTHDGCHYAYEGGYRVLGDRYAALLGRDLYGETPMQDVQPPNPASAQFQNAGTEIVLAMRNEESALMFEDGAQADFRLVDAPGITVVSGAAVGHEVTLTLSGDASAATGLTYLGRPGAGQWVTNENGLGMLTFLALPIAAQ